LVAAVDQAADAGCDELASDLAGSLIDFLDLRGYDDKRQQTQEAALAAACPTITSRLRFAILPVFCRSFFLVGTTDPL